MRYTSTQYSEKQNAGRNKPNSPIRKVTMFTLCLCCQKASLMGYRSTVGLWNKHPFASLQCFLGRMGLLLAQHVKAQSCGPSGCSLSHCADDCGPFCTSNKSAAGASLWGSLPSDCQRPSTEDVTLACMIYLTPSPWNSFAEKEKHDICMVNDFLKGRKKTSKLLCSVKWASKRIAFSKFISISQLDGYQPLVGGKNPTRLM